jgi:hypothetical protein
MFAALFARPRVTPGKQHLHPTLEIPESGSRQRISISCAKENPRIQAREDLE